jgi:PPOX class probable F420-dependent enzyme
MNRSEALRRVAGARVARFATTYPDGRPHQVPVTFTLLGPALVHMIDHKQKTTTRLQRLVNLESNSRASLLVDHYEDSWNALWWVRVDGLTSVLGSGPEWEMARAALADKYPQYAGRPPEGPALFLEIGRVSSWENTG